MPENIIESCIGIHIFTVLIQDGCAALTIAAQEGHHECLSLLLARGADVNKAIEVSEASR